ncbi:MAG: 50S ribosomal protein L10 [Thermoleophilia bacterium]|nr:50S ribosomal protein L10 [Thermoleophilia bacterium]
MAEISERLGATPAVLATSFSGLTVKEMSDLRVRLREVDAQMQVVKNTLARIAARESGREGLLDHLTGTTALVWAAGDPAAAAKVLNEFGRASGDRLSLKGGLLDDSALDADAVRRLATLPSREQLLAQLAGGVASPLTGVAGALNNLISGLARSLAAVRDQRSAETPA